MGIGGRVLWYNSEGLLCTKKSRMFVGIRFFPALLIVTKFRTKFYHNLVEVTVVFSVCFYDSYFISFAYSLSSWLQNPSKWNSCCFHLHNLVSVNKNSCQNELYQLVPRPKYIFTKTTKLYCYDCFSLLASPLVVVVINLLLALSNLVVCLVGVRSCVLVDGFVPHLVSLLLSVPWCSYWYCWWESYLVTNNNDLFLLALVQGSQ